METILATLHPSIIVAIIALIGSAYGTYISRRNSKATNLLDEKKVDAAVFERAAALYDKALAAAELEVQRMHERQERLAGELQEERRVSTALRSQLYEQQVRLEQLHRVVAGIKSDPPE
jgi:hypothetical protein